MQPPDMVHFTEGGVWHGYMNQDYADVWLEELEHLLGGANPCAKTYHFDHGHAVIVRFGEDHGS